MDIGDSVMYSRKYYISNPCIFAKLKMVCWLYLYPSACSRAGDEMCTIAACISFPEPFVVPSGQKRLGYVHRKFAGSRHSDHLAMLSAFYQWEQAS